MRFLTQLFNHFSLKTKLALLIFSVALFTLIISASFTIYNDIRSFHHAKVAEAQSIVDALSQEFVRLLTLSDVDVAADIVSHFEAFPEIKSAFVYDKEDRPIFQFGQQRQVTREKPSPGRPIVTHDYLNMLLPIVHRGEIYGNVFISISREQIKQEINKNLLFTTLIFFGILVLSLFLSMLIQKTFTQPIYVLGQFLDKATTSPTIEDRIPVTGHDEISRLHQGFNHMIDAVQQKTRELHQERDRLHVTLESLGDGVITTDAKGLITYMNNVAILLTGWSNYKAIGHPLYDVYQLHYESNLMPFSGFLENCLEKGIVHFEYDNIVLMDPSNKAIPVQTSISPIYSGDLITGSVVVFRNITEYRELSRKLNYQAKHDKLTGLINRHEFETRLQELVASNIESRSHILMYLDLDQFKVVNDVSGHIAGDAMLKKVAHLLSNNVRTSDIVARFGGDEFGIILADCDTVTASNIANNIIEAISQFTFVWEDNNFKIGVSIGLVSISHTRNNLTELLRDADIACYAAKDMGRNRIHIHEDADSAVAQRQGELYWITRLNEALKDDGLELYLQRIFPVNNKSDSFKFEVLLRLTDPGNKVILPGAFLPAAERYGLVEYIDRWVIENVLKSKDYASILIDYPSTQFNINLSGKSLSDEKLTHFILEKFEKYSIDPKTIYFEITETAAIAKFSEAIQFAQTMRAEGCQIALDDFGSGLSSFAYLKNLPVDYLKIDGSFVRDIHQNAINFAMVRSINELGQIMGIKTVAEYVENALTLEHLRDINVDYAQGFHLHIPSSIHYVAEQLTDSLVHQEG